MSLIFSKQSLFKFTIFLVFCSLTTFYRLLFIKETLIASHDRFIIKSSKSIDKVALNNKWVVVATSKFQPSEQIKYLHDSLFDWSLLVIGDFNVYQNYAYKQLQYINLDHQINIRKNYRIISKIPFDSHLKKTIGFLHAILNGAQYIYETEDGIELNDGLFTFKYEKLKGISQVCENCFINPYSHFGKPLLFPRGLSSSIRVENCRNYSIYTGKVPVIQHGMINGKLDTINSQNKANSDVNFDYNGPALVLSAGQYAPFSSRNTLFHYNAFWALLLPISVDEKIADIFRAYISLRLLREINETIAFVAPNAISSLDNEYNGESDAKLLNLVDKLEEWQCEESEFKYCILNCIKFLISNDILEELDYQFYQDWIHDLDSIGYKWPKKTFQKSFEYKSTQFFYKHPIENIQKDFNLSFNNCDLNFKKDCCMNENKILVTLLKTSEDLNLVKLFTLYFPNIVVCINTAKIFQNSNSNLNYILFQNSFMFKDCAIAAFNIGFNTRTTKSSI